MSIRSSRTVIAILVTLGTFADILAYSIAVPVLPDLSRRFGASPTVIGLLFASFGLTLLLTSVPMGAISDRIGRKTPLVGGLVALSLSTVLFAFAPRMSWLFAARLVQGAADAVTWVVGFAVVADMYDVEERGPVLGLVMSGSTFGFMVGPTLGGWLYEAGGVQLPYLAVAALSLAIALALLPFPLTARRQESVVPFKELFRLPAVVVCSAVVVVGGGTIAMLEPVLSLFLSAEIGLGASQIGLVFGAGALVSAFLHPIFGKLAGRFGSRRLMLRGLAATGAMLPAFAFVWSVGSAAALYALGAVAMAALVTPSLAYMAEAMSDAKVQSFGMAYGVYNFAWAVGLLIGPSFGGLLYERLGLLGLSMVWAPTVILLTLVLARVSAPSPRSASTPRQSPA